MSAETLSTYQPNESYLRVATARPEVTVGDVASNVRGIAELYTQAADQDVSLVTFPELSLTGYTLGDLVKQTSLLRQAQTGVLELARLTEGRNSAMVVGLPFAHRNARYNCAAVLADGQIKGVVAKQRLPRDTIFQEPRWYQEWRGPNERAKIGDQVVPIGVDMLFEIDDVPFGVEICEDAWLQGRSSDKLSEKGALVVVNLSASPERLGAEEWRQNLVTERSGTTQGGYAYVSSGPSESTASIVMSGHHLIGDLGTIAAECEPFGPENMLIHDMDIDRFRHERMSVSHNTGEVPPAEVVIDTGVSRAQTDLHLELHRNPFLPEESAESRAKRLDKIISIQTQALYWRMKHTRTDKLVLGLSGGLDSTMALLIACETARLMGKEPGEMLETLTMPGLASKEETQNNAQELAKRLGISNKVIPIGEISKMELELIGHDATTQDIAYENAQARARSNKLFNYANHISAAQKIGTMVLGTGNLGEIMTGHCTYNADQQSHIHINGSLPKSVVREGVRHLIEKPRYAVAQDIGKVIIKQMVSPELVEVEEGEFQSTDSIIGPEELREFFMYYLMRWGDSKQKIAFLADQVFEDTYTPEEVRHWLGDFLGRVARSQFKRNNMPDSPQVGAISGDPRAGLRWPSDLYNDAIFNSKY